ncbi:hypothetical protein [Streptomyces xanthophaeus]|uniref:hypothetical protein n=1 Tax=Streptomyces xanthophaeus TaxID=67385 RepID=UPI002649653D|nr:hypothetical protein [Streptomyces xanthophaeus]WKD30658.1 hypothetical protein KO717_00850 [Streptomyces xanthophaeus]
MTLVIELRRGMSTARTRRNPGPRAAAGMLERIIVDGARRAAIERLDHSGLSTLACVDPYGDTTLRGEAVARMVRELEGSDLARLHGAERGIMATLLAWGLRCRRETDLRIAFPGD